MVKPLFGYCPLHRVLMALGTACLSLVALLLFGPEPFGHAWRMALAVGVALGLAESLHEALRDNAGNDDYLRAQIRAPQALDQAMWSLRWKRKVGLGDIAAVGIGVGLIAVTRTHSGQTLLLWAIVGFSAATLAAYPHWRSHWRRLVQAAKDDEELRTQLGVRHARG